MSLLAPSALVASLLLPLTLTGCGGGSSSSSSGGGSGSALTVSFQSPGQVVDESSGVFSVVVRLSDISSEVVTVDIGIGAGSANLSDFQLLTNQVAFDPGEFEQFALVEVFADSDCEGQETIRLLLGAPTNAEIGAIDRHDIVITGSVVELEPNDDVNQAVGIGPLAALSPGVAASLCGTVLEIGATDDFDVYMIDVTADTEITLDLTSAEAGADFILILAELGGIAFQVVDVNGVGGGESAVFNRLAGQSFVIAVSVIDPNQTGNPLSAEYEVFLTGATPLPLPPPARDEDRELQELLALDAGWSALIEHAAARDEPVFARR